MTSMFRIAGYRHDAARRKSRFRCQCCRKLIEDGSEAVVERRPGGAHGYHAECFDQGGDSARAVIARAQRQEA